MESGQLTAEAEATANEGELNATVDLTVSRLDIEKLADGKLSGIPIKTGLALLEGPDGKITLTIPISGSLDDLEFDFSQAINKAIGGAVRSAIGTSFKILFPLAGIVSLLSEKTESEVADVPFEPGSADLGANRQSMEVEGPQPLAGTAKAGLRDLAVERTRTVRRYLISQAGLTADRITACRPQVNPESSGAPRVEVSL